MSQGKLLNGQGLQQNAGFVMPFTQRMMDKRTADALVGTAATEITPNDEDSSVVRVYTTPNSALDNFLMSFDTSSSFSLPDVLTGITVTFNKSQQSGESIHQVGTALWEGTAGGLNLDPVSSAQGSASILPDVAIAISQTWAQNVPTKNYVFYVNANVPTSTIISRLHTALTVAVTSVVAGVVSCTSHGLTAGQPFQFATLVGGAGGIATATTYYVLAASLLTNSFTYAATAGGAALVGHSATSGTLYPLVQQWPTFRPASHTLTLKGEQVSLQQSADSHIQYTWNTNGNYSYAWSPFNGSRSDSISRDGGITIRTLRLPPTIHGLITLTDTTDSATTSVTVVANIPGITGWGGAPSFSPITNTPTPASATVNASVTPTSLAATSGQTSIPTAGLYILESFAEPFFLGYNRVRVQLVNFSYFA